MKKFLFAVLMLASVLCLVFGAAACGETGGETAGSGSQEQQQPGEDPGDQGGAQKPDEGFHTHVYGEWLVTKEPTCQGALL